MPWKLPTWKGLTGLISMLVGIITAAEGVLPGSARNTLIAVGAALLAVERYADSIDNQTASTASPPTHTAS